MEQPVVRDVSGRVHALAVDIFETDPELLTESSTADDIEGWDSLALLNLLVALEDEFGISLPPDEFAESPDFGAIVSIVAERVSA
jgi:acyl carrier protein